MSEAIFVEGLTKKYGEKTVVNNLNLSVKRGTVFGLLGANGAGKSTTIECILGTKNADEGTVRLLGQDPKKQRRSLETIVKKSLKKAKRFTRPEHFTSFIASPQRYSRRR